MDEHSLYLKEERIDDELDTSTMELRTVQIMEMSDSIITAIEVTDTDGNFKISTIDHEGQLSDPQSPREITLEIEPEEYEDDGTIEYAIEEAVEYKEAIINNEDNEEVAEEVIVEQTIEDDEEQEEYEEGDDDFDDPDYQVDDPDYQVDDPDYQVDYIKQEKIPKINCDVCNREFKTNTSLKRHISLAHGNESNSGDDPLAFELCTCCGEPVDSAHMVGDIRCDHCDKRFVMQENLSRHISIEHNQSDLYTCIECLNTFPDKGSLIKHMVIHPLTKPFVCKACNKEFTRKYHLERHISQTGCDGTPKNSFKCEVCLKVFARKDNLRDHLRAHAGQAKKKKTFVCEYCDKVFQGSGLLSVHLRTHTGERPYPCDLCPKRFPSSGAMKKHRRMHTGEKPYECSTCKKRFAAKETLNRHVRTHTGDKPHSCHFCGKSFIQAAQLRAHIFHHTGENAFTCPHCNRAFNRRVRLTMHIQFVHEGAEPMQCDHCKKKFYRKEDLQRHHLLHSGVKPFECEVCRKRFAVKSSLKLHMLTHRKEPPCSCDECGRAFIRQDCLLRHMRAKHRDVLEDIMAGAEKKRLQQQLLSVAQDVAAGTKLSVQQSTIWDELTLTDSVKELLTLLVDESTLEAFGWPDTPVDKMLDLVIKRCGHQPASEEEYDYIGRMRENAKLLFTVVIDDEAIKSLLNNQTVDEVILHVLRLAKSE